jgi:hypothetical protein
MLHASCTVHIVGTEIQRLKQEGLRRSIDGWIVASIIADEWPLFGGRVARSSVSRK